MVKENIFIFEDLEVWQKSVDFADHVTTENISIKTLMSYESTMLKRLNLIFLLILALVIFTTGTVSAMTSREAADTGISKNIKERLVWPPPPYEPKIELIKSITKPGDIGIKKGFFRKAWEFIAGEDVENRISKPFGIAVDNRGKLYITDTASLSVHIFDLINEKYHVIEGVKGRRFASPVSVAVDKNGDIFVSDSIQKKIYVFSEKRKYLREIRLPESLGEFKRPTGLAINKTEGSLYIVDTVASTIHVFSTNGEYKSSFGERGKEGGQLNFPTFITISGNGDLYVSDSLNFRIQVFDNEGNFIRKFGKLGDSTGDIANPRGVATDSDGNIYVVDTLFEAVQIFDKTGNLLFVFGKPFIKTREFALPSGIAIDLNDYIYIADTYNSRIQVFKYLGKSPSKAVDSLPQKNR